MLGKEMALKLDYIMHWVSYLVGCKAKWHYKRSTQMIRFTRNRKVITRGQPHTIEVASKEDTEQIILTLCWFYEITR